MLAEAVAAKLKKKLLIVEFPKLTSRWYGETDKALSKIFTEAKKNNLVVCIDEADTLLYNRNFAAQEHDIRFVNIMLQEIENFAGEMILTTNMDNLLDPALERRVTLKVNFELPDEKMRAQIWRSLIPDKVTIAEGIDFLVLANQFSLSGGYIKNAVLHAMRRLASEGRNTLTKDDLLFGARLEQEGIFVKESKPKIGFFANC
jgi:SpoVK/Ycf46/Vps4 family AAA+-type ATPase